MEKQEQKHFHESRSPLVVLYRQQSLVQLKLLPNPIPHHWQLPIISPIIGLLPNPILYFYCKLTWVP